MERTIFTETTATVRSLTWRKSWASGPAVGQPARAGLITIATDVWICSWRVISTGILKRERSSAAIARERARIVIRKILKGQRIFFIIKNRTALSRTLASKRELR